MPLIVEDGNGVEDANSYVSLAEAREIAAMRGITLSADDAELTSQLIVGGDRVTSYESKFTGRRATGIQGLSYPRKCSMRYGETYPSDSIPKELKLAQVTFAGFIEAGVDVWASTDSSGITREKVGPIETEYSEAFVLNADGENPYFAQIESILNPLFAPFSPNFLLSR